MEGYKITQLPSGYWCVWYNGDWVEASLPSKKAAEEYIKDPERYYRQQLAGKREVTDYSVNYLSRVSRTDKYHRSEIILHRGNGYYLAEFYTMDQLDEFAKMMGFTYKLREYRKGAQYVHYWEYDISRRFVEGHGFNDLSQLPEGAKPFLGLSNGSIVTCYFVNDGETVTIYRPNPNCEDIYHPLPLKEHIAHQQRLGVY